MPIITINPNPVPANQFGAYNSFPAYINPPNHLPFNGGLFSRNDIPQVVGLVPVFPCNDIECRLDKFLANDIFNDEQFTLPVFAQVSGSDLYFNDQNSWLFELPLSGTQTIDFFLDKLIGNVWVNQTSLINNNFGIFYSLPKNCSVGQLNCTVLCPTKNWTGYLLYWQNVLNAFGEGVYRFRVNYTVYTRSFCFASPPFCLKEFDCFLANRTTKFESYYFGGRFGSVNKKYCGGKFWDFCCVGRTDNPSTSPINWYDSIRIYGFLGREDKEYERVQIKYQTGVVNKIRDEAIRKFKWKNFGNFSSNMGTGLPFWFHDRFSVYGLMSPKLLVSDYNLNNSQYELKRYCVIADSNYTPEYKGFSRYSSVELQFKSQNQYLIKTNCC